MSQNISPTQFAADLIQAHDYRAPISALSNVDPGASVEDAYLVQVSVLADMIRRNDPVIGAKVGTHDRRPVFSLYPRSSLMGTFEVVDRSRLIEPTVQPVIVLRLFKPLSGTNITEGQVQDATESVVAGIEVIDSRLGSLDGLQHVDLIADNGGIAKILIGEHGIDINHDSGALSSLTCQFTVDDQECGPPANKITQPLAAVAALANHLGSQGGMLEADWFVVVGPLTSPGHLKVGSKAELHVNDMAPLRLRAR
jgi:2-keto-4-pentenoate hydratase